jgi:hypothetical protein
MVLPCVEPVWNGALALATIAAALAVLPGRKIRTWRFRQVAVANAALSEAPSACPS